jgi:hypothetical protein
VCQVWMQLLLPWLLDFRIHGLLVLSVNLNLKQQMIGWAPKLRMFQPMWRQQSSVALLKLEAGRLSFACLDGPNRLQGNSFQEAKWCTAHRCAQYEIWCCNMLLYIYIYLFLYIHIMCYWSKMGCFQHLGDFQLPTRDGLQTWYMSMYFHI